MAMFRQGLPPLTGVLNAGLVGTNCDRRRYSWLSIDDVLDVGATIATIHRAVDRRDGDGTMKLYLSQLAACTATTKRREQHLFVVRHESSSLSATAELLVIFYILPRILRKSVKVASNVMDGW